MPLRQLEEELRLIARERIAKGHLACKGPLRMWAGHGTGQHCALCDKPIQPGDVEYEVEAHINGASRPFRFHVICEALWQLECARDEYVKRYPQRPVPP